MTTVGYHDQVSFHVTTYQITTAMPVTWKGFQFLLNQKVYVPKSQSNPPPKNSNCNLNQRLTESALRTTFLKSAEYNKTQFFRSLYISPDIGM